MKKFYIYFLLLSFITPSIFAQKTVESLVKQGIELHDNKKYKEAIKKYSEALEMNPKAEDAVYEMAFSYLELGEYDYVNKLTEILRRSDNRELQVGAVGLKSEALANQNKTDEAIKLLKTSIAELGDEYLLHFNLALNYYKKKDIENARFHVRKAIDANKTYSEAFLLNAYITGDMGLWVRSILSFQMFLLLEPDSERSQNAFQEMLQLMQIVEQGKDTVQRSFYQIQTGIAPKPKTEKVNLSNQDGLDRNELYKEIQETLQELKKSNPKADELDKFKAVNKALLQALDKQQKNAKSTDTFWTFYVPFFTQIEKSKYYEAYTHYISVSYFPESSEWWNKNKDDEGKKFLEWFENGDDTE